MPTRRQRRARRQTSRPAARRQAPASGPRRPGTACPPGRGQAAGGRARGARQARRRRPGASPQTPPQRGAHGPLRRCPTHQPSRGGPCRARGRAQQPCRSGPPGRSPARAPAGSRGDGRKRVGVERSSQRPAERCDRGDGRDPGRERLLLRLRVEGKCVGQRQGWAVKPVEGRHGGDEGDERRGVDHARRLPGGDKVKGRRRGRLERRELVRVKLRGKARLWSLQERDELGVRAPTVTRGPRRARCGGVTVSLRTGPVCRISRILWNGWNEEKEGVNFCRRLPERGLEIRPRRRFVERMRRKRSFCFVAESNAPPSEYVFRILETPVAFAGESKQKGTHGKIMARALYIGRSKI